MPVDSPGPVRLLVVTGAHDAFVERVEADLAAACAQLGGELLRIVEGRRPANDGIPTIDLDDAVGPAADPRLTSHQLQTIIDDSVWFERTLGLPAHPEVIRVRLTTAAGQIAWIVDRFAPTGVLAWNGMLSLRAVAAAVARGRGVPLWQAERGPLPGSWYADPVGINAASSLVNPPLAAGLVEAMNAPLIAADRAEVIAQVEADAARGASAWGQPARLGSAFWRHQLGIRPGIRVAFFPMQVDADTNMRFFSPHFADSLTAASAVVDGLAGRDDWVLLVKPHPMSARGAEELQALLGRRACVVDAINLHDALDLADLVVTINSTVAAEAAWRDRPVLQLGRGILSGQGIVAEWNPAAAVLAQCTAAVAVWRSEPMRYERALRFRSFLRDHYLRHAGNPDDARAVVHAGHAGIACEIRSPSRPHNLMTGPAWLDAYHWRPAERLCTELAGRVPAPAGVLLLGYGQNAQRLLSDSTWKKCVACRPVAVWDDDGHARQSAAAAGWPVVAPEPLLAAGWLAVLTPRQRSEWQARLAAQGWVEGDHFLQLCGDISPGG